MSFKVIFKYFVFFCENIWGFFYWFNHSYYPWNAAAANLDATVDSGVAAAAAAVAAGHKADAAGEGAEAQHCGLQKNSEFGPTDGDEEEGEQF